MKHSVIASYCFFFVKNPKYIQIALFTALSTFLERGSNNKNVTNANSLRFDDPLLISEKDSQGVMSNIQ